MKRIYEDLAYSEVPYRDNFWRGTVEGPPDCDPQTGEVRCDVAIIGGGFTGLNAALTLAQAGRDVIVIEAEHPGWGASGRNGGFCCLGGGKVSARALASRFGEEGARAWFRAERAAIDHVRGLLDAHAIDADTHSEGETLLAHSPRAVAALHDYAEEMRRFHGVECRFHPAEALEEEGMNSPALHGGMSAPLGFALNPARYVQGLVRAARQAGARIFCAAPVTATAQMPGGGHRLTTARGGILATQMVVATNGYSSDDIPGWLAGRYLPSQSHVIVTRPLTEDELAAQGWTTGQMCYDTRNLLHYLRLMPDRRMLFGMRGSLRMTPASLERAAAATRADFDRFFPAWRHVETPWTWSGMVCLARGLMPYVGPVPDLPNAWTALAYHGNGVAMGSYCGHLLACQMLRQGPETPSALRAPLRRFELGRWRRLSLPLAYGWYAVKDRR